METTQINVLPTTVTWGREGKDVQHKEWHGREGYAAIVGREKAEEMQKGSTRTHAILVHPNPWCEGRVVRVVYTEREGMQACV